jgi:hypothetical protein
MSSNPNENKHFWRSTPARKFGYSAKRLRDFFRIYDQPADFLVRTAIQVSHLEEAKSREIWLPGRFFAVATLLVEKHSELVLGFSGIRVKALVDHLIDINRDRPQPPNGNTPIGLNLHKASGRPFGLVT